MIQSIHDTLGTEVMLAIIFTFTIVCGLLTFFALSFQKKLVASQFALAKMTGQNQTLTNVAKTIRENLTDEEIESLYVMINDVHEMKPFSKRRFIELLRARIDFLEK